MQCDHFTRKSQLSMVERPLAIDLNANRRSGCRQGFRKAGLSSRIPKRLARSATQ